MKKLLATSLLVVALLVTGCGNKDANTGEKEPKAPVAGQTDTGKNNPHEGVATEADAAVTEQISTVIKEFWTAMDEKNSEVLKNMLVTTGEPAETITNLLAELAENEIKSFTLLELTKVYATEDLAAVGYVVEEEVGEGMKTKLPEMGIHVLIKTDGTWKLVMEPEYLSQEQLMSVMTLIQAQQVALDSLEKMEEYTAQQEAFMKEARDTNQKFIEKTDKAFSEAEAEAIKEMEKQQQGRSGQKPPGHP